MNLTDRFKAALAAFVATITAKYDYAGTYSATVIYQNSDGTLELKLDAAALPGLSRVPIRYGIPGVLVTVRPGARVGVRFDALDPSRPFATVWERSDVMQLKLDRTVIGRPVARMGDTVKVALLPVNPVMGTVVTTGVPVPFIGLLTVGPLGAPAILLAGNPKVRA